MRERVACGVVLLLALILVYHDVYSFKFVTYDDHDYVTGNEMVRLGLSREGWLWAWSAFHASNWHPLTWLSHMLDVQLFGLQAGSHHLVNVFWHGVNTVLVFVLLQRLTGGVISALLCAALFSLHPLRVESVAWISERKDLLCAAFFLSAMLAWLRHVERPSAGRYALALAAFAAALASKPMAVTLPFVLLLLDYWPGRRWEPGVRAAWLLVREKLPFFALTLLSCVLTYLAQSSGRAMLGLGHVDLAARGVNAVVSYARYLWLWLWPTNLAVFYPHPGHWGGATVGLAAGVLVAASVFVWTRRRREPGLLVGWLFYLGTLVPVIGVVQVGEQALADRYTYLPLLGPCWMVGLLGSRVAAGWPRLRGPLLVVAASGLSLLALLAQAQVEVWRSSETLFRHATQVTSGNYVAENNLGAVLVIQEGDRAGVPHFEAAIEARSDYADAHYNLGTSLAKLGQHARAIASLQRSLALRPDNVRAVRNLARTQENAGLLDDAMTSWQRATELAPDDPLAFEALAQLAARSGDAFTAIASYRRAVALGAPGPTAIRSLAWLLITGPDPLLRRPEEALALARRAVAETRHRNPRDLALLANALAAHGEFDEAVEQLQRALVLLGERRAGEPEEGEGHDVRETLESILRADLERFEAHQPPAS